MAKAMSQEEVDRISRQIVSLRDEHEISWPNLARRFNRSIAILEDIYNREKGRGVISGE